MGQRDDGREEEKEGREEGMERRISLTRRLNMLSKSS